jgi:hypothetical protein
LDRLGRLDRLDRLGGQGWLFYEGTVCPFLSLFALSAAMRAMVSQPTLKVRKYA